MGFYVVINWADGPLEEYRKFYSQRAFATRDEAEREGLLFGKQWIDDGKPNIRDAVGPEKN